MKSLQITSTVFLLPPFVISLVFYEENVRYVRLFTFALFLTSILNHQRNYSFPRYDFIDVVDRITIVATIAAVIYDIFSNVNSWDDTSVIIICVFTFLSILFYIIAKTDVEEDIQVVCHGFVHAFWAVVLGRLAWK